MNFEISSVKTMQRQKTAGALLLAIAGFAICTPSGAGPKTDVVVISNGDRLTGEVKGLERGKLAFDTDATGTIRIEWDEVARLTSDQYLQIELQDGTRYFGSLKPSDEPQRLTVASTDGSAALTLLDVVSMDPIERTVADRIDIDVSAGFTYAQASEVGQISLGLDVSYRDEKRIIRSTLNTMITDSANNESSQRTDFGFSSVRILRDRWVAGVLMNAQRNDELGLDRRISIGGGGGRHLVQSNQSSILAFGGLLFSQEKIASSSDTNETIEGLAELRAEWFRYDEPELDLTTDLSIYPNLSDFGRIRADLDIALKWEVIPDVFWGLSFYNSYDSDPPSEGAERNDFGVRTSIGWDVR